MSESTDVANMSKDNSEESNVNKSAMGPPEIKQNESTELTEEARLKAKYPNMNRPVAGHSAFLQKRINKGTKYFDSGDYQMAKQRPMNKSRMPPLLADQTGQAIPTPESVPIRKTSIIQHSKLTPMS